MVAMQATAVRKNWSMVCDTVIRERPQLIKRTRDELWLMNKATLGSLLDGVVFSAVKFVEEDGSVTLSIDGMDLVENGTDLQDAAFRLGCSILEYANEYYDNYFQYANSPNRQKHIPFIFKALVMGDPEQIGRSIICRDGQN